MDTTATETSANTATQQPPSSEIANDTSNIEWTSEAQIEASLARIYTLQSQIHSLRTLLPNRLLAPLKGINAPTNTSLRSPETLYRAIATSFQSGMNEIGAFKKEWEGPEMRAIWGRVRAERRERGGWVAQVPNGVGLRGIGSEAAGESEKRNEANGEGNEDVEMTVDQNTTNDEEDDDSEETEDFWQMVETFKADNPRLKIEALENVVVMKFGGAKFKIEKAEKPEVGWVITKNGTVTTGLMRGIMRCLEERTRKGSLRYTLSMLSSYVDIQIRPCKRCGKLLDSKARLPYIRKAAPRSASEKVADAAGVKDGEPENDEENAKAKRRIEWDAWHESCV